MPTPEEIRETEKALAALEFVAERCEDCGDVIVGCSWNDWGDKIEAHYRANPNCNQRAKKSWPEFKRKYLDPQ